MNKLNLNRLKKTKRTGKFLACFPYIRCVILNGSLAAGKSTEKSDIDLLIIAKPGHIFTARFFVMAFMQLFRLKRAKFDSGETAGKHCLNYFLTEDNLKIYCVKGREEFCASNYAASKFLAGDYKLFIQFMQTNEALFQKFGQPTAKHQPKPYLRPLIQRIGEWKLSLLFGARFENWAKRYQVKKIESDPRTQKFKNEIHYSDSELRFHPPKGGERTHY